MSKTCNRHGLRICMRRWLPALGALIIACILPRPAWAQFTQLDPIPTNSTPAQVYRVYLPESADAQRASAVAGNSLDIWSIERDASQQERYLVVMADAAQVEALRNAGFRVERDEARSAEAQSVQDRIQSSAVLRSPMDAVPGFPCYRTVETTHADMAQLAADYPLLASWLDVGDSWDKETPGGPDGYDLPVLIVSNKASAAPKAVFFLLGALHAREMTTAESAARFAEALVHGYGGDPDITWLLDHTEIHIMPIANPDGRKWAEAGYYWRKNTNTTDGCTSPITEQPKFPDYGVDLNRNSSFKWNECEGTNCSSSSACSLTYRGSAPASEPETSAVQAYMERIFADQRAGDDDAAASDETSGLFISLHSYSELVLFPWGWTTAPTANDTALETLGRKFGYFTGYEVCQAGEDGCIYPTDGTTDDWAYGELGVASYTFELGTSFFQSCTYFEDAILDGLMPALFYAAKAARRPYQAPAGPEVRAIQVSDNLLEAGTAISLTAIADDTRFDSNGWGDEPTQSIAAARYTLDNPAWITGTEALTLTVADGAWDAVTETVHSVIDTTGWSAGRHTIFVEAQDAAGNWGVPSAIFVDVAALHDARLSDAQLDQSGYAGDTITYTLTLTNSGLISDVFILNAQSEWPIALPTAIGPLDWGESASVPIAVTVPTTATLASADTAIIAVTSQQTGDQLAEAQLTTRLAARRTYLPWTVRQ